VNLGNNVCLSQGSMLLTGNHDFRKKTFDLIIKPITLEDGVWIGAKSVVCPGVYAESHSILTVQSVVTSRMEAYTIYQGNPAKPVKIREIKN
jgi:putative colanic acid biosynthesis acetyltransferase WcaF